MGTCAYSSRTVGFLSRFEEPASHAAGQHPDALFRFDSGRCLLQAGGHARGFQLRSSHSPCGHARTGSLVVLPAHEIQTTGAASEKSESRLQALHLVIPKSLILGGLPTSSAVQVRPRGWKNSMTGQPHPNACLGKPDF